MYRNEKCCKRKVAYDMEGAAERWDTHPAEVLYLCNECGFVHFARNNEPRMDRRHAQALRMDERRKAAVLAAMPVAKKKRVKIEPAMPKRYGSGGTCKIPVWKASGCSIGEIIAARMDYRIGT